MKFRSLSPLDVGALWLAAGCASLSGVAFLFHALGWLAMPFFITCVSLPAALVLVALYVWARSLPHRWLAERIWAGSWIGFAGTLAYDGIRYLIAVTGIFSFDPFRIIHMLGALITTEPPTEPVAIAAGWTYHFWNGMNFATMYVLVAGRGRWPLALAWAMCLEVLMMATYPGVFAISQWDVGFVSVSMIGHVAYGVTLGVLAQRQSFAPVPRGDSNSGEA